MLGRGSEGCEERETERGFFRFELLSPNLVLWEGPLRDLLCSPLIPQKKESCIPSEDDAKESKSLAQPKGKGKRMLVV